MDTTAADPKWLERLVQTREQTAAQYFTWCNEMLTSFMDFAREYEKRGDTEAAFRCQRVARTMRAEMEKILQNG